MQRLVNDPANPLGIMIRQSEGFQTDEEIIWKSPLASDEYAEYRDQDFLGAVGLQGATEGYPLARFWPSGGPQWDALARTDKQRIILVEAKSHTLEMRSTCGAKDPSSIRRIHEALDATRVYCGSRGQNDWSAEYYQYANRLAHLYWLRVLNKVDAHLFFIYFVNDSHMGGPKSESSWKAEIAKVHEYLGLNALPAGAHEIFFDVAADQ